MSMHKPERQPNESFADYKIRRKMAKDLVKVHKTGKMTSFQTKLVEEFKRRGVK